MTKRLNMLESLKESGKADSFALYALALEYKSLGRIDDALRTFETLREKDENYIPMYLMAGSMLVEAGEDDKGRQWLELGQEKAKKVGDTHAYNEMDVLLQAIG